MNNDKKFALAVLFLLLDLTHSQIILNSDCPENIKVVSSFDVEKYLGKWYEYSKYPVYFETGGKCITAEYSLNSDGNVIVKNTMINQKTKEISNIRGVASLVSPGKLLVKFPVSPDFSASSNYWVLATDYDNYTVVYSCSTMTKSLSGTIVWILTRLKVPSPATIENAMSVLRNNNISLSHLTTTNQVSCDV